MKSKRQELYEISQNADKVLDEYHSILRRFEEDHKKYEDEGFYPKLRIPSRDKPYLKETEWKRIEEIYETLDMFQDFNGDDVIQGELSDCFLINVLSQLTDKQEDVKTLFADPINLESGCVCVRFEIFDKPAYIIIDTQVPVREGMPIFAHPHDGSKQYWFCLIEKAYTKFIGGFEKMKGGAATDACYMLKGYYPYRKPIEKIGDSICKFIEELIDKGGICYSNIGESAEAEGAGLNQDHSYSIKGADKVNGTELIHLWDPHGKSDWKGDFSAESDKWGSNGKSKVNFREDGHIWMTVTDFKVFFNSITCNFRMEKDSGWTRATAEVDVDEGILDGRTPLAYGPYVGPNPQFLMDVGKNCEGRILMEIVSETMESSKCVAYAEDVEGGKVSVASKNGIYTRTADESISKRWLIKKKKYTLTLSRSTPSKKKAHIYFRMEAPCDVKIEKLEDPDYDSMELVKDRGELRPGKEDGSNEYKENTVRSVRQWELKVNEDTELFVRIKKKKTRSRQSFFIAQPKEEEEGGKYVKCTKNVFSHTHIVNERSELEEFRVKVKGGRYVVGMYREEESEKTEFEFEIRSRSQMELNKIEEFEDIEGGEKKTELSGDLESGVFDGRSPYGNKGGVEMLKQWHLRFEKETKLFMELEHNGDARHRVVIYESKKRFGHVSGEGTNKHFETPRRYDRFYFRAEPKDYVIVVFRDASKSKSKYKLTLHSRADEPYSVEELKEYKIEGRLKGEVEHVIEGGSEGASPWEDDISDLEQYLIRCEEYSKVLIRVEREGPKVPIVVFLQRLHGERIIRSWRKVEEISFRLRSESFLEIFEAKLKGSPVPYSMAIVNLEDTKKPTHLKLSVYSKGRVEVERLTNLEQTPMMVVNASELSKSQSKSSHRSNRKSTSKLSDKFDPSEESSKKASIRKGTKEDSKRKSAFKKTEDNSKLGSESGSGSKSLSFGFD